MMLSGLGFNETGGALLFNHPGGIATDGQHLVVADTFNNRILVWNSIPSSGSVPPDFVLGQSSFTSNAPGKGLNGLDWPNEVSIGGGKLVVADNFNNRILIWNTFPTKMDQPADIELVGQGNASRLTDIDQPVGVWTDGNKLAVSSTFASEVLIWNTFPTKSNQSADLYLTAEGNFGTPRWITSDGTHLMVGDNSAFQAHPENAITSSGVGSFVWNTWPTQNDQPYSYFETSESGAQGAWGGSNEAGFRGQILSNGETVLLSFGGLIVFNSFPTTNSSAPNVSVTSPPGVNWDFEAWSELAVAGSKVFLTVSANNYIAVYNSIPTSSGATPSYVIGSPNLSTNTLLTHYILNSPQPATDGRSLFVADCMDGLLLVYGRIPDQSGAYPNAVYSFSNPHVLPCAVYAYNGEVALGFGTTLYIWSNSTNMFKGQQPDIQFEGNIGTITLQAIEGVAIDSGHFYLADAPAGEVYVWNGLPSSTNLSPASTLSISPPGTLSTDGSSLVVVAAPQSPGVTTPMPTWSIAVYNVSSLSSSSQPKYVTQVSTSSLVWQASVYQGHLYVPELSAARVLVWNSITSATSNLGPAAQLGCLPLNSMCQEAIGPSSFLDPEFVSVGGGYLWIGEHDFSDRLLRFSFGTLAPSSPRVESYYIQTGSQSVTASLGTTTTTSTMLFSSSGKSISMNLTANSPSYVNATFPTKLLNGSLTVTLDGASVTPEISHNSTHTAVYAAVPAGSHTLSIVGTLAAAGGTTTTSTTTSLSTTSTASSTVSSTSATTSPTAGLASISLQPSSGPSGSLVTISGTGFAASHTYRYCYQTGGPPPPPNQPAPCSSGSSTFVTGTDGLIPSSPPVTLQIAGSVGVYTVVVSDTSGPLDVFAAFTITPSTTSSTSTASTTTSSSAITSSLQSASTSTASNTAVTSASSVSEFPTGGVGVVLAGLLLAASLLAKSQRRGPHARPVT